ncbi:hypothetical protein P3T73_12500 [Kiritimatiellota bacterium B12222]|nr:hypothetical protein P3T73_12500 [Kiritimatiellota bacterium B12222]
MKKTKPTFSMKRNLMLCSLSVLGLGIALNSATVTAAIIAQDDFSYTVDEDLNTQSGGSGWGSNQWIAETSTAANVTLQSKGAQFTGTDPDSVNFAYRQLDNAYSGDTVYVSYTLELGQTPDSDFFALWLDNTTDTNNNHGSSRLNTGLGTADALFSRLHSNKIATNPTPASADTAYNLVVRYSKSVSGESEVYNTMKFWINPTYDDLSGPGVGEVTNYSTISNFSYVGFRGAANEGGESYFVDDLVLATEWGDVVAIPEPATWVMFISGMSALFLGVLRGRNKAS